MRNRRHEEQLETPGVTGWCAACGSWTRHGQGAQCLEPTHPVERRNGRPHEHKAVRVDRLIAPAVGEVAYRWCECGARSECATDGRGWSRWTDPGAPGVETVPDELGYTRAALATALKQIAALRAELACVYETQDELVSALERAARKRVAFLVPE